MIKSSEQWIPIRGDRVKTPSSRFWASLRVWFAPSLTLTLSGPLHAQQHDNDAIVYIYSAKGSDKQEIGTGFFVDNAGDFVTAYHVIRGANHIDVYDDNNDSSKYDHIQIIGYDALDDVALLSANAEPPAFLSVVDQVPHQGMTFRAIGHPFGFKYQTLQAHTTQNGFADSLQLSDANGSGLYRQSIKIIPLDMTMYNGMSGAPLINASGSVIGVLLGSINTGGSLAWAVPASAVLRLMTMTGGPRTNIDAVNWGPLQSYSSAWRGFEISKSLGIADTVNWMNQEWRVRGLNNMTLNRFQTHITGANLSYDENTKVAVINVEWTYVGERYVGRTSIEVENASHATVRNVAEGDEAQGQIIDVVCPSDRACASETITKYAGKHEVVIERLQRSKVGISMWFFRDQDAGERVARAMTHLIHLVGGPVQSNEPFGNDDGAPEE